MNDIQGNKMGIWQGLAFTVIEVTLLLDFYLEELLSHT